MVSLLLSVPITLPDPMNVALAPLMTFELSFDIWIRLPVPPSTPTYEPVLPPVRLAVSLLPVMLALVTDPASAARFSLLPSRPS
jgi:hypothetical protein